MASIRKRGNSYLIVVSMGYTPDSRRRKQTNKANGKPLSEATVEGVHSCLCGILSDAMEGGYLDHNPAWRTYKYAGQKKEKKKKIADDETVKKLIQALETVSILHETYFKLIIATGMRRGKCCALKWEDINYAERSIHVCRNAVKTIGNEIIASFVRPTRFERATYRVGVFRHRLIKCCVFKTLRVFARVTANYQTFAQALKTLGKTAFSELRTIVVK